MKNFALIGVAGYIAERHVRAIKNTGNHLIAALDPCDSVGFLDHYDFDIKYFSEFGRFDRYIEKLRVENGSDKIDYISICVPNYLHDSYCRFGLRADSDVICEKPLVINPWNLNPLLDLEQSTGRKIKTVLQLRLIPDLLKLKKSMVNESQIKNVVLTYITSRGNWYASSWKGSIEKSGGILTNIGIHFFDLVLWLFGSVQDAIIYNLEQNKASGFLRLEKANVRWFLSTDHNDLPYEVKKELKTTYRAISIDDYLVDFTDGFTDLHTKVYEDILSGGGFGIEDAKPSIQLTYDLRNSKLSMPDENIHPFLQEKNV
jgi:UDP-N-acetyl-2-amino-2-deoxyglucuronate dehydrogenase